MRWGSQVSHLLTVAEKRCLVGTVHRRLHQDSMNFMLIRNLLLYLIILLLMNFKL